LFPSAYAEEMVYAQTLTLDGNLPERFYEMAQTRETGLYRIRIEYIPQKISIISDIIDIIGYFDPRIKKLSIGLYERRIYLDPQVQKFMVGYKMDLRSYHETELGANPIHHTKRWDPNDIPKYTDKGFHIIKPPNSKFTVTSQELNTALESIKEYQGAEAIYRYKRGLEDK